MSLNLLSVVLTRLLKVLARRECDGQTNDFTKLHFEYTFSPPHYFSYIIKQDEYLMSIFVYFPSSRGSLP